MAPRQPINIDLNPEALRPQARPVDAFVRPAAPSGPAAFLSALGKISPQVMELGGELLRGPSPEEKASEAALMQVKHGDKTADQLYAEIEANPNGSPVARQALGRLYGGKLAAEAKQWAEAQSANGDLANSDPDQLLKQYYDEKVRPRIGDNKHAARGFAEAAGQLPEVLRAAVGSARNAAFKDTRDDSLFAVLQDSLKSADPEKVPEILQGVTTSGKFLAMPRKEQEKLIERVTESLSLQPGKEGILDAIGATPSGVEGVTLAQSIGPRWDAMRKRAEAATHSTDDRVVQDALLRHGELADDGKLDLEAYKAEMQPFMDRKSMRAGLYLSTIRRNERAIERIKREAERDLRASAEGRISAELVFEDVDVVRSGRAADLEDYSETVAGKQFTITAKDRKERALAQAAAEIQKGVTRDASIPEEQRGRVVRERQVALYGRNGEIEPRLKRTLTQLSNTSTFDDETVKAVATYLPELAVAHKAAPKQVYGIFSDDAGKAFVNSLVVAQEAGMEPRAALNEAVRRRDLAAADQLPRLTREQREKVVEESMKAINSNGWLPFTGNDPRSTNQLQMQIARHADFWFGAGASLDNIPAKVGEMLKANTAFVGGHYVDTQHLRVPAPEAQKTFESAAAMIKEAYPQYAKSEITFIPVRPGSTAYRAVALTPDGVPLPIDNSDMEFEKLVTFRKERMAFEANERRAGRGKKSNDSWRFEAEQPWNH